MYFAPKNCFLTLFCELQEMKMDFLATFLQFQTIYYINYYIRQLEQSCWKIPFSILQLTNKAKKAIFWSKIHFFRNIARFARKLLSIRILLLTHSKLVGTPCITLGHPVFLHASFDIPFQILWLYKSTYPAISELLRHELSTLQFCGHALPFFCFTTCQNHLPN